MKLIINEKQEQLLIGMLLNEEKTFPVEPEKVLVVKKYLDKNFIKGKRAECAELAKIPHPAEFDRYYNL